MTITNPTSSCWRIQPVIDNESFSSNEVEVPPNASADSEIVYKPLSMTADDATDVTSDRPRRHQGTAFFPLPNGQALLYQLSGIGRIVDVIVVVVVVVILSLPQVVRCLLRRRTS